MTVDPGTISLLGVVVFDVARWIGVVALLLPIAVAAAWLTGGRRVEGFTIAVGIAAVAAAVALLGVALSFLFALDAVVWAVVIALVDAVVIVALLASRRGRRPEAAGGRSPVRLSGALRGIARQWVALLIGVAAIAVTVAALAIARDSATQTRKETTFTQLWMLPTKSGSSARVGIRNVEDAPRTYHLRVAGPGGSLLAKTVRVRSGATRTARVRLPLTRTPHRITATASAVGFPGERRTVDVWTHAPS